MCGRYCNAFQNPVIRKPGQEYQQYVINNLCLGQLGHEMQCTLTGEASHSGATHITH
jgi:hypothetical protein